MGDSFVMTALAVCWIPTVFGLVRAWRRYFRLRKYGGQGFWLVVALGASLVTPIVCYISLASLNRILGQPPFENSVTYGILLAFDAALVVPLTEIGVELWSRGLIADPVAPPPSNGKGTGHDV